MNSDPALKSAVRGESLDVSVSGSWTAANLQALEPLVETAVNEAGGRRLHVDMHGLGEIDTFGACLLNRLIRGREGVAGEAGASMPERMRGLLTAVERVGDVTAAAPKKPSRFAAIETLGRSTLGAGDAAVAFVTMLGALGEALLRVLRHPRRLRPTSFVYQLDRVGLRAVPIIILITVLIGAIIAQQGFSISANSAPATMPSIWSAFWCCAKSAC